MEKQSKMIIKPEELDFKSVYKLLTGLVIPRPIGWVATVSEDGVHNLAPFSFFNAVSADPPTLMFSASNSPNANKDTSRNALQTGEFVVNMVTENLVEQMNDTAAPIPSHESEFDYAKIAYAESTVVKPRRVANAPISFECKVIHHHHIDGQRGGSMMILGEIVMIHINDQIVDENYHTDLEVYQPISRLAGAFYARLGDQFVLKRAQ